MADLFIKKAHIRYNSVCPGLYDYTKVDYKTVRNAVIIKCNFHDVEFQQSPNSHVRYYGCIECSRQAKKGSIIDKRTGVSYSTSKLLDPKKESKMKKIEEVFNEDQWAIESLTEMVNARKLKIVEDEKKSSLIINTPKQENKSDLIISSSKKNNSELNELNELNDQTVEPVSDSVNELANESVNDILSVEIVDNKSDQRYLNLSSKIKEITTLEIYNKLLTVLTIDDHKYMLNYLKNVHLAKPEKKVSNELNEVYMKDLDITKYNKGYPEMEYNSNYTARNAQIKIYKYSKFTHLMIQESYTTDDNDCDIVCLLCETKFSKSPDLYTKITKYPTNKKYPK